MAIKYGSAVNLTLASAIMGSGVGYSKIWAFHISSIILIFIFLLLRCNGKKTGISLSQFNFDKSLLIFLIINFSSLLWSINSIYTLFYLFYLLVGTWIILIITSYIVNIERFNRAYFILSVVFFIALLIGILETFEILRLPTSPYSRFANLMGRESANFYEMSPLAALLINRTPTSFWPNPNTMAVAFAMISPMFVIHKSILVRTLGLLIITYLIVMSGSRGALIAYIIGLTVIFSSSLRKVIFTLSLFTACALFFAASVDKLKNSDDPRLAEFASLGEAVTSYVFDETEQLDSVGIRKQLVDNGLLALYESGGLGVGAGGSVAVQEKYSYGDHGITSMHNFWIEILVDSGVAGFFFFVLFYLLLAFRLFKIGFYSKLPFYQYHGRSLFYSFVIFSIGCISASSVIYFLPMWIMFGLALSLVAMYKRET